VACSKLNESLNLGVKAAEGWRIAPIEAGDERRKAKAVAGEAARDVAEFMPCMLDFPDPYEPEEMRASRSRIAWRFSGRMPGIKPLLVPRIRP
jgi:hypothetical protein